MLHVEWNMDDALAVAREEAHEEGHAEGRTEERKEIINLLKSGKSLEEIIREYSSEQP
jgi:hypothetical protein